MTYAMCIEWLFSKDDNADFGVVAAVFSCSVFCEQVKMMRLVPTESQEQR